MNRVQKNQQTMGNSVTGTCNQNHALYQNLPKVTESVNKHKSNMDDIGTWEEK